MVNHLSDCPNCRTVRFAVKAAAAAFEEAGWRWYGVGIPSEDEIALEFARLVDVTNEEYPGASCGRLRVEVDPEDGTCRLLLELGTLYDERHPGYDEETIFPEYHLGVADTLLVVDHNQCCEQEQCC